jgi:hypothetical protein
MNTILATLAPRLPALGQAWLDSLDRGEQVVTEDFVHRMGEDYFIDNWEDCRDACQEARDF